MKTKFWVMMVLAMVAMCFTACGDDDSNADTDSGSDSDTDGDTDGDTDTGGPVQISGAMQKGPLIKGSSLTVAMLDTAGVPTGVNYETTTEDDLGAFSVVAQTSGPCELVGEGFYFNEITNGLSGAPITMRALYEIKNGDPQKAYLNVFTHLSSGMALKLFREGSAASDAGPGLTLADAIASAEDTTFDELGIQHPLGVLQGHGTDMDLTGVDSPDNEYVMAVSCIIGKAAELRAATPDEVDARLQEMLNDIRSQLQTSGMISGEYKQYLRDGEAALDPLTGCVQNLKDYLENKTGSVPDLPDPNQAADMDGDGTPNAQDDDIDGDGIPNADDEAPYDAKVGGGMYLDAVNGLAWMNVPPTTTYTWADAGAYCDGLSLAGHDDWRMPTISELRTLVQGCTASETNGACEITDACNDCSLENCTACEESSGPGPQGAYWDPSVGGSANSAFWAETPQGTTSAYWTVDFKFALISAYDGVLNSQPVRCVRTL